MITIKRNPNFREWLNITLRGKVIDNARTMARAMRIAEQVQDKERLKGNRILISAVK